VVFCVLGSSIRWISTYLRRKFAAFLVENRSTLPMRRDFTHSSEIMTIIGEISPHFADMAAKRTIPDHNAANSRSI